MLIPADFIAESSLLCTKRPNIRKAARKPAAGITSTIRRGDLNDMILIALPKLMSLDSKRPNSLSNNLTIITRAAKKRSVNANIRKYSRNMYLSRIFNDFTLE